MLYDLNKAPLHFDNSASLRRRFATAWFLVVIFVILAISCDANYIQSGEIGRDPIYEVVFNFAWPWFILPTLFLAGKIMQMMDSSPKIPGVSSPEKCEMTVDEKGIFITRGDRNWLYLWTEISSSKIINVSIPGRRYGGAVAVQIRVKGHPIVSSNEDLIDGTFGIALTDLNDLIHRGIEKWGTGSATPASALP